MGGHHPADRFTQGESAWSPRPAWDYHLAVGAGVISAAASPGPPAEPVLVAAKLHVPALRAGMVSRDELVGRLVGGGDCKLVLVCAPAGWGKTSVLSQWHSAEPGVFAWVSLDPGDDDRVRFWSYVIGALRTVAPEVGEAALAALPNAPGDLTGAVLPSLLNELAVAGRRLVLVLDDYHCVREGSIHASVAYLLRHLPPNVQLAIATRGGPAAPAGQAARRGRGPGDPRRAASLQRRRGPGAAERLARALGLEPAEVALLRERTEGWPAGLLAGQGHFTLNGEEHVAGAGQTIVVPAGVPHSVGNPGPAEIDAIVEYRPALRAKEFHEAVAGLAADGKTTPAGAPKNPLQRGATFWHFRHESRVTSTPIWIQNLLLPPLWALAKVFGVRPYYHWDSRT